MLHKLFKNINGRNTSKFIKPASIITIPRPDNDMIKIELHSNISEEYRCKNSQQNTLKQNTGTQQKDNSTGFQRFYSRDLGRIQHTQNNMNNKSYK